MILQLCIQTPFLKLLKMRSKAYLRQKKLGHQKAYTPRQMESMLFNQEYVVQPGDTLAKIAKKLYGSQSQWRRLADTNSISNPNKIFPGDVLKYEDNDETRNYQQALASIGAETTVVQAGETLGSIAERVLGKSDYWKPIWRQNIDIIPNPNMIFAGQTLSYIDPNKVNQALGHKHDQMTH